MLERLQVHFINQPPTHRPHHISSPQVRHVSHSDIRDRRSQHPAQQRPTTRSESLQLHPPNYTPSGGHLTPDLGPLLDGPEPLGNLRRNGNGYKTEQRPPKLQ